MGIGPDLLDLSAEMNSSESISLTWTAPADADGSTSAMSSYEIRFSKYEITGGAWNGAEVWGGSPTPSSPGNTESVTITGLDSDTTYYFAIKSIDAKGFLSDVSNSASSKTSSVFEVSPSSFDELMSADDRDSLLCRWNLSSTKRFLFLLNKGWQ